MSNAAKNRKQKGRVIKNGTREKIIKALTGRPVSKETREKIKNKVSKPVELYSLDGTFIDEYPSIKVAANFFKISSSVICNNIKGLSKTTKHGIWKFKQI